MRVLILGEWGMGGIQSHVRCLLSVLKSIEVENNSSDDSFKVYCLGEDEPYEGLCNGHDIRKLIQLRRVVKKFKPDVVHVQKFCLVNFFYLKFFTRIPRVVSLHMPYGGLRGLKGRILYWLMQPCYFLPVSSSTMRGFSRIFPTACGEVFYNPIQMQGVQMPSIPKEWKGVRPVVGMVGRSADVKDWPSFHEVERLVKGMMPEVEFVNGGEEHPCDGRKTIAELDLFVMTSKHEELPTTMLECFLLGTPICGFLPVGGTCDVLGFSNGAVRDAFSKERDCRKLADTVVRLLNDEEQRRRMVEDGWQILKNHFAAETLVKGQLMDVYRKVLAT